MSLENWNPETEHLTNGYVPGQHMSAKQVFVAAGPPLLGQMNIGVQERGANVRPVGDIVYPLGMLQSWALQMNQAITQLFEIGSGRSYFMAGHSVGQLSLSHVLVHGPNLLRMLMAWVKQADDTSFIKIDQMVDASLGAMAHWVDSGDGEDGGALREDNFPTIHIPPGYDNHYFNLASDLFKLPHGLYFLLRDTRGNNMSSFYLEQCYIPGFQLGTSAQGIVLEESLSVRYERMVPIPINAVRLLDTNKLQRNASGLIPGESAGLTD